MALRAGYYGVKRFLRDKLELIAGAYDETIKSLFPRSEQAALGVKNLLKNTASTTTINGVTFTVNADKSVTVNGTATATINAYWLFQGDFNLDPDKEYIFSGCPAGGSSVTYNLSISSWSSTGPYANDIGNGVIIKGSDYQYSQYPSSRCGIYIREGVVVDNLVFKPMIRLASDPDNTYAPYAMTNRELTNSAADQKTAINAIITAATEAADFAAFKTAMGAITPVTRSLSLTKEDITEEVKEAEPEKTVTKKRTTKKTEEV